MDKSQLHYKTINNNKGYPKFRNVSNTLAPSSKDPNMQTLLWIFLATPYGMTDDDDDDDDDDVTSSLKISLLLT
jgi:hypothetical protein